MAEEIHLRWNEIRRWRKKSTCGGMKSLRAEIGLFTKMGHFISLISTDGKEFCILDPSYTPEKFKIPERAGRVNEDAAPFLYADVHMVDAERRIGRPIYHLFARKK